MEDFIKAFRRYCGGSAVLATLIGVNLLVFLLVWVVILAGSVWGMHGNFTMPWLCVPSSPLLALQRPWTLLTYMVVQYDFIHLIFNLLWLFWFGVFIPFWVSERLRVWLYIGGGVTGALLYVAVNALWPESASAGGYLCGASASVLAFITAVACWAPRRTVRLFLIGDVQLRWVAIACMALTFFGLNGGSGAAQSAHIGGAVFGVVYALITARTLKSTSSDACRPSATPRRKVRVNVHRDGKAVAQAAASRLSDTGRLDQLLDKIRLSGYASLTAGERNELNLLSQRLDKKQ